MKTKIYHGSLNEITNFKGRIWCSSDIRFANEAILMQDNFEHDFSVNGDFGHIYFTEVNNEDIIETDDLTEIESAEILKNNSGEIFKASEETEQPTWFIIREASKYTWCEIE